MKASMNFIGILVLIFLFILSLAVGAGILRAAIAVVNNFSDKENHNKLIPEPSFGSAMGIVFLFNLAQFIIGLVLGMLLGETAVVAGINPQQMKLMAFLFSLPFSFLILVQILTSMLPTSFRKACLVALCQFLISIAIVLFILALIFLVSTVA